MEKVPLLLPDVRAVRSRGESSRARLREAVRSADLLPAGSGLGSLLEDAMVLRPSVTLGGARRTSEVAALRVSNVRVT